MRVTVRRAALAALGAVLAFAAPGFSDAQSPSPAAQSPSPASQASPGVPARVVSINRRIDINPDGSSTITSHLELQIVTSQLIAQLAQPALDYSESLEDLQIKNAYTLKRDGTRIDVSPGGIITRQKTLPAPFFTDEKEKVILFPNVEAGDTIVYDVVMHSQAHIPGQFYFGLFVPRSIEVDDQTLTFVTSKEHPLTFEVYGLQVENGTEGDRLTYTIHYVNRVPVGEPQQFLSEYDQGLRVFATTAASYDALAAAYGAMAMPKAAVTPKIQAKADEITAGTSDRREQARKLYEWVSSHVRYVAVLFGDGGLVPHDADSVLTNAFGDCKDHAVLYSALLKAKGISSELVIINGTNGYIVPTIPQILPFNHMIVWLPEFGMYADTTSDVTPFGSLPQLEYGKPVIHIGGNKPALRHVPVLVERESTYASSTSVILADDGTLSGHQTATGTGAMSAVLRSLATQADAAGVGAVADNVLKVRKMDPAAGTYTFQETSELTPRYTYTSSYQTSRTLPGDVSFAMPEGLNIVDAASPALLGPATDARFKQADVLPCFSGDATDDYSLTLPQSERLVALPRDSQVDTDNIHYHSHWAISGNIVTVHREVHAHFDKALCSATTLRETRQAMVQIRVDYEARIALTSKPSPAIRQPANPGGPYTGRQG